MPSHRLLVVEDHSWSRHPLQGIFGRMGWEVTVVATVADGLRAIESVREPCCLVLDLNLPDGNGETVLQRVRELGLRSRVVVGTGVVERARLLAVAALEPDKVLIKPYDLAEVWDCP